MCLSVRVSLFMFFFSSRRRHTRSVSAFLLNRSSDLSSISDDIRNILCGMALLILALLQRIFLMSSLMLLLVWLIFFMVLIKLLRSEERRVGKECRSGREVYLGIEINEVDGLLVS